ncbi:hypothetical protein ACWERV_16940 [Streptomyces sp. NPDC004031]
MNTLNWRNAHEVRLTDALIPNPASTSQMQQNLSNVRVAFDAGLVHIDPRHPGAQDLDPGNDEFTVYVVAASAIRTISYQEPKRVVGPEVERSVADSISV